MNISQLNKYTTTSNDVMVKSTITSLTYNGKQILWSKEQKYNDLSYIIDAVNKDYIETNLKAIRLLSSYTKETISPEAYLKEFTNIMSEIHPYFCTRIRESIIPAHIYACYFILNDWVRNHKKKKYYDYNKDLTIDDYIAKYLKPLTDMIYYTEENSKIIINYFKKIAETTINPNYLDYDLETLTNTIELLRAVLYIYSNSYPVSNSKSKLFIDLFERKLEVNVHNSLEFVKESSNIMRKYSIIDDAVLVEEASIDDYINEHMNSFANESYVFYRFEQLLFLYLDLILENNQKLKRCQRCDKLFIPNNYNEKYCYYKNDGTNQTCRDVGTSEKYKSKCENSATHDKLRKIQKRFSKNLTSIKYDYDEKISDTIKSQYYENTERIIQQFEMGLISDEEGDALLEASYKEVYKLLKSQIKENENKKTGNGVNPEKERELKQAVDKIMEKYINRKT